MTPDEPIVVRIRSGWPHPRRAVAADALLVDRASAEGPAVGCADLFPRYPGLTLVVLTGEAEMTVGVRDGRLLVVRPVTADPVEVARLVYRWWSAGLPFTSPAARAAAASAGLDVTIARGPVQRGGPLTDCGAPIGLMS